MLGTPVDFKEQMVEARRTQILMGAAEVFVERGFHKARVRDIAKAAGISEGTIYNYFDNKRELLFAMIELIALQPLKSVVDHDPPDDPKAFLQELLHERYQLVQERGYLLAPIMAEIFTDANLREEFYQQIVMPTAAHLEHYVQTYSDSGSFRQIDPLIVTRTLVGAMFVNFALKLAGLDPRYQNISADSLIEQIMSLLLDGLLANEP
jgi:AcrR family transcriptional regulator